MNLINFAHIEFLWKREMLQENLGYMSLLRFIIEKNRLYKTKMKYSTEIIIIRLYNTKYNKLLVRTLEKVKELIMKINLKKKKLFPQDKFFTEK